MRQARYHTVVQLILLLLVTTLVFLGAVGIYYNRFWTIVVVAVLAFVLATLYFIPQFTFDKSQNQNQFRRFALFLLRRPMSDWAIATAISLCGGFLILATSRFVSPKGAWNMEAPEAVGTMISLFMATIAASVLYRRHAPIDELEDLLKLIIDDLSDALNAGRSVWISFPALSIGCHSSTDDHGNIDLDSHFWTLKKRLGDCLESRKVEVRLIVYDDKLTQLLFTEYHNTVGGADARLEKWKEVETAMRTLVPKSNNCMVHVDPTVLTNFVIVIGTATYLIQAHGFPHYVRNSKDKFAKPLWQGHFVKASPGLGLLAYRREDSALAFRTIEQLKLWLSFLETRSDLAKFL
jgi:hypothetical protein